MIYNTTWKIKRNLYCHSFSIKWKVGFIEMLFGKTRLQLNAEAIARNYLENFKFLLLFGRRM